MEVVAEHAIALTGRDAQGRVVVRLRVEHQDRRRLREQLRDFPKGTVVVVEATFGWGWICDELASAGLEPRLANSRKVAQWRKARGLAKTNTLDADLLSELPMQQPSWWKVWLAPPEVRSQREWMRYRMSLVQIQTSLKNRMHAVLHRHGIGHAYSDLFGGAGRRFLQLLVSEEAAVRSARGEPSLPASGRAALKGQLQLLDQVRRQIAQVTRELRRQVQCCPAGERLRSIPGIAWILSYTILAEIGRIERFRSYRHLASYSLLAPLADDSGEPGSGAPLGRHVGFVGRRTLKWAWIEAAHVAVRCDARFRAIFDRRTNGGKRDRNRGYIAVAHQLCRIAYVLWTKEVMYSQTPPARPGAEKSKVSRPGMGQPDVAMAVAVE